MHNYLEDLHFPLVFQFLQIKHCERCPLSFGDLELPGIYFSGDVLKIKMTYIFL